MMKSLFQSMAIALIVAFGGLMAATLAEDAPTPFKFEKGDTVAILGNGLADRMQHDGWMETLLQSQLAGQDVRFRNMSASGDRPESYPRSGGATSMNDYLKHVKADVVLAFFGYNESYAGVAKVKDYHKKLVDFVSNLQKLKPNGKSAPRIVLFSPIAREDTHNPNVPDGTKHNAELEAYTIATESAAKEAGVAYVDLFHPSLALYKASKTPLTINGVHLSAEGNRQLAEVIATALMHKTVTAAPTLEPLRQAVLDKSLHWYNRYRAADGNDIWGGRSGLSFTNKQTNRTVLQHELLMLDVMTANRDPRVWAAAQGKELKVDDSNVPPPVPVITNLGGRPKDGGSRYISGEEGIKKMAITKGFAINLFADEKQFPQLVNPVQMQVSPKGDLWVAVWPTYPMWEPLKKMNDAILVFHDDKRTGKATSVTEFAKVQNPLGFEFWNGGILVTCMTDLVFLKDTDGDGVADVRISMLQGLDTADTHHGANNLTYGPDGAIYWQSGVFMQHNHEHPWGPSFQTGADGEYRFDPRTFAITFHAGNGPNSHGIAFDYWGNHYATDGTSGNAFQVRPHGSGFKMFGLLTKEVRPVTSCEIVSSANFPENMQGDFLICNVIGFLGIKQYRLDHKVETGVAHGQPNGDFLSFTNPDGTKSRDQTRGLMMSSDKNFRPTDAVFGADGALYISDWQNAIIGHMQHNVRDPERDHAHGRIYRMVYTDRPLQADVPIAGQPIPTLLENLKSPVDGIRQRTRIELSGRDSKEVIAAVQKWITQFDVNKKEDAHHLLEALWLHQQHNVRNTVLLDQLLKSPEPRASIAAATVKHLWTTGPTPPPPTTDLVAENKPSGIIKDTPELTEIRIGTVKEKMTYDVSELTIKAGKKIRLTFANVDYMPHNLVIVNPGKADAVGELALKLGVKGFELGWVPESPEILWSTKLLDNGKEQILDFTAPANPGDYPYLCTFPGHHTLMRGVLHVK